MVDYLAAGAMGLNALGNMVGGMGGQDYGNLHMVNRGQQDLWTQMAGQVSGGGGDFGFGNSIKQGKSQVQDFMAQRGVRMGGGGGQMGGAYAGAMGNMMGQATAADAQSRRNYALQLLGTPMQVAQSRGANFLPGSTSRGANFNAQQANYWGRDRSNEWGGD